MDQDQINKVAKVIKIGGMTATVCALVFLLFWTFCGSGAKKPLTKGEDQHWLGTPNSVSSAGK